MLLYYIILIISGFSLAYLYRSLALKLNILDRPNERTMHLIPTVRGGGIIFPLMLVPSLFFAQNMIGVALAVSLLIIAFISFWDDVQPRTPAQRFIVHAGIAAFWAYWMRNDLSYVWLPVIVVGFIAFLNAYNFMDGINGITVLYTAAVWALLRIFESEWLLDSWGRWTIVAMDVAIVVFAFFNLRKRALFFSGDVGAMTIACFLGVNICLLIARDGSIHWLALVLLYGVDTGLTIIRRFLQGEKIWEAHRKHVYQKLVYFYGWSHLQVSAFYSFLQLTIGASTLLVANTFGTLSAASFLSVSIIVFAGLYYFLIRRANQGAFIVRP